MRRLGPFLVLWFIVLTLAFAAEPKTPKKDSSPQTRLLIRSGTLVSQDGAPIELRSFEADIADGVEKNPEHMGNKIVSIKTGSAFLSNDSLSRLLNHKLKGHNLDEIRVTNDKGKVKITGKARKAISVPFTIEGPVSLTGNGLIKLEMADVKVAHLPKGVAEFFGIDPEKMAGDGTVKGVSMDKNAISFDPDLLWGLPVHGQVTRLAVEKNGLRLIFGEGQQRNHMAQARPRNTTAHNK